MYDVRQSLGATFGWGLGAVGQCLHLKVVAFFLGANWLCLMILWSASWSQCLWDLCVCGPGEPGAVRVDAW